MVHLFLAVCFLCLGLESETDTIKLLFQFNTVNMAKSRNSLGSNRACCATTVMAAGWTESAGACTGNSSTIAI